jgi:hypothetical protein
MIHKWFKRAIVATACAIVAYFGCVVLFFAGSIMWAIAKGIW